VDEFYDQGDVNSAVFEYLMSRQLAAYRNLLRSVKATFKGDEYMQTGALTEARSKFKECVGQEDQDEIEKAIAEAYEAAEFIKTFVVQAKLNDRGNFAMQVEPHHAETSAEEAALRPSKP